MTQYGPLVSWPTGYSAAPSPYANNGVDACCELCGHKIVNVYGIQCDRLAQTLRVGSECVTRFAAGESGEALAKRTAKDRKLAEWAPVVRAYAEWLDALQRAANLCAYAQTSQMTREARKALTNAKDPAAWLRGQARKNRQLPELLAKVRRILALPPKSKGMAERQAHLRAVGTPPKADIYLQHAGKP
jgi:hypothetical protein